MKKNLIIAFYLCIAFTGFAQNKYVDSLENWLTKHPELDTTRVMTTHRLSYRLSEIDTRRAWKYANETQNIAKHIGFERGACLANINFAILESNEGDFKKSADYYLKAIEIAEKNDYTRGLSISYNNIADNYMDLKDYETAIFYSEKALQLNKSINEKRGQAFNLEQLGNIYFLKNNLTLAKEYWDKGYELAKVSNDGNILGQVLIDLAKYQIKTNNADLALTYLNKADSISTESGEVLSQILTYKGYANLYEKKGMPQEAIVYLKKALKASILLNNKTEQCDIYNLIAYQFEQIQKFDSGIFYLRKHKLLSDTVLSDKNFAHLAFIQTKHESELKEKENRKLKSIQKNQSKRLSEKNVLLLVTSLALLLAILSIILIIRSVQNKKKNALLEEQSKLSKYNQQIAELEVKSLRSQMNPHFLFNSLNSIRNYIIKNEPQLASNYLADFATLMRKILDSSQQSKITIEEEIATLKLYLNLELMRFSNGFKYSFDVEESLKDDNLCIPPMIIQPFVENAIWHGLLNKEEGDGILTIRFKEIPDNFDQIICEIEDNGIGRAQSAQLQNTLKKHKSKGINITQERLKRLSGKDDDHSIQIIDLVNIYGSGSGTKVVLRLPLM